MRKTFCDCCGKEVINVRTFTYPSTIDKKTGSISASEDTLELCDSCMLKAVMAALKELEKIKKEVKNV